MLSVFTATLSIFIYALLPRSFFLMLRCLLSSRLQQGCVLFIATAFIFVSLQPFTNRCIKSDEKTSFFISTNTNATILFLSQYECLRSIKLPYYSQGNCSISNMQTSRWQFRESFNTRFEFVDCK